jgi:murein DD-endopeptidase MepM/ murein hydrolase activator NlpD
MPPTANPKPPAKPQRTFRKNFVYHPVMPRNRYQVSVNYLAGGSYKAGNANTYGNWHQNLKCWQVHTGIDLNARTGGNSDTGHPVFCVADGEVLFAGNLNGWGGVVVIKHPQFGVRTRYAHVDNFRVKAGDFVLAGQQIAKIAPEKLDEKGNRIWFSHLHFDVYAKALSHGHWCNCSKSCVQQNYLDPAAWLLKNNAMTNSTLRPADD